MCHLWFYFLWQFYTCKSWVWGIFASQILSLSPTFLPYNFLTTLMSSPPPPPASPLCLIADVCMSLRGGGYLWNTSLLTNNNLIHWDLIWLPSKKGLLLPLSYFLHVLSFVSQLLVLSFFCYSLDSFLYHSTLTPSSPFLFILSCFLGDYFENCK